LRGPLSGLIVTVRFLKPRSLSAAGCRTGPAETKAIKI
jgi:hypothetical protein